MLSAIIKALIWVILVLLTLFALKEWKNYPFPIVTVVLMVFIWFAQKLMDKIRKLPPGPFRFPVIGCLPQILLIDNKFPFRAFYKLSKTYGNIMYIQVGLVKGVVINGYETLRDMYADDDWIGRMDDKFLLNRTFDKPLGLVSAHVDIWRETRRFTGHTLHKFGFGVVQLMESVIQEELEDLITDLKDKSANTNGEIVVRRITHQSMINITWSLVSGNRYTYDDPKLKTIIEIIGEFMDSANFGASLLTSFPILSDWAPKFVGYDRQRKSNKIVQQYFLRILSETRDLGQYMKNPTNFIEVYLKEIDTRVKDGTVNDIVYSDENLVSVLYDLFLGSAELASNTIAFGILYLCLNPDVQEKVYQEIESVIGAQKPPSMADKERMIYTEATLLEISRLGSVAPISPRRLYKDATIGNYQLRKGDTVFANNWSVGMDENFWGDPEIFRPERFVDSTSGQIINAGRTFQFAAGKRNCIGERVARTAIFILFIGILQRYELSLKKSDNCPPTITTVLGLTLGPEPFTVILTPRH